MKMSYALKVPPQVVSSCEPRTPSPLSEHQIAKEQGIEHQQVLMLEASNTLLPVTLWTEIVPLPDTFWQRLSSQKIFPSAEGQSQLDAWEEFLTMMKEYLQHMVISQFNLMNETYASIVDQVSVRHQFHDYDGQYIMTEMTRLIKCVKELEATENPGDLMQLCIEDVDPILHTPNYHCRLLDGISHQQWSLVGPKPKRSSRRNPYGKKGSKGNTPRGSR
jgi:hypothetical protein